MDFANHNTPIEKYQDIIYWSEGRQYLILFQDLFWEDEIVEEILILRYKKFGLENLLGQLNLQNPKTGQKDPIFL